MPKYQRSKGYEGLIYWTRMELRRFYEAEGYSKKEATKKAQSLYWKFMALNAKEAYSWNKARELERPYGVGGTLHELNYSRFDGSLENIWNEIQETMKEPEHELTHYERLRGGKKLRMDVELKRERAERRMQKSWERLQKRVAKGYRPARYRRRYRTLDRMLDRLAKSLYWP